jgi:hypothetical protein
MTTKRIVPNGDAAKRIVPTPASSGGSPTPPASVTFPSDTTLVERMRVAVVTETPQILAPGWSY